MGHVLSEPVLVFLVSLRENEYLPARIIKALHIKHCIIRNAVCKASLLFNASHVQGVLIMQQCFMCKVSLYYAAVHDVSPANPALLI